MRFREPGRSGLMAQPAITAPIASATSVAQMVERVAAAELQLSAEDRAQIDTARAW